MQFAFVDQRKRGQNIPPGYRVITRSLEGESVMHPPAWRFFASGGPVWQGWLLVHIRHSWTIWMRIATYNVNGVNGRLANLLGWLEEAAPNVVCLQELKAPDEKFPETAIRAAGYGAIRPAR